MFQQNQPTIKNQVLTWSRDLTVVTGSKVLIGRNCLFADNALFYAGDAHVLIDNQSRAVKNARPDPIVIGNHCWLGRDSVFTKGSGVADNTVVGIRSVVTKRFKESFVAIAGCPAKIVTMNVDWHAATPEEYMKITKRRGEE